MYVFKEKSSSWDITKKSIKSRIGCNDMIIHLLSSMGGSEKERLVLLIKICKTLKHYFIYERTLVSKLL